MSAAPVTQWFAINVDGQPVKSGWWDVLYIADTEDESSPTFSSRRYWFDGHIWRHGQYLSETLFGNANTTGERYRGLAEKPT